MFESGYLPMLGAISWKSGFCHRSKANITIYRKEMRTSIHCALLETYSLYNTVAFTMISGFSMSFLLWTILSSRWAEFGLFPSPACAKKMTSECQYKQKYKNKQVALSDTPLYFFLPHPLAPLLSLQKTSKAEDQHCNFSAPLLWSTSFQERNTALLSITKRQRHALGTLNSRLDLLRSWQIWELKGERIWKKSFFAWPIQPTDYY